MTDSTMNTSSNPVTDSRTGRNALKTMDAVALTVGSMVGAGIFSVLALTVQAAGPGAVFSWILVVVMSTPMAITFSGLIRHLSESGGPYVFLRDEVSPFLGWTTGWLFFVSAGGAAEALYMAAVGMLHELGLPGADGLGLAGLIALGIALSFGIHVGARIQRLLTLGTVLLLTGCAIVGLTHADVFHSARVLNPTVLMPHGTSGILLATFLAFWTYSGWEAVSVPSGSYQHPHSLSRGMMIGSLLVGVLYIVVALAAVLSVPAHQLSLLRDPLVLVGSRWNTTMGFMVGWGALVVVAGSLLSWVLATTSLFQSLLRDQLLPGPRRLRQYKGEYHPSLIWVVILCLWFLSRLPWFNAMVAASSMTALFGYGAVFAAVVVSKNMMSAWQRVFAIFALCVTVALVLFSGWHNIWPSLILTGIGAMIVLLRIRFQIQEEQAS